jgi:adenylate cyclase
MNVRRGRYGPASVRELEVRRQFRRAVIAIIVSIDVVGATAAAVLVLIVVPLPAEAHKPEVFWGTIAVVASYAFGATCVGARMGSRLMAPIARWVASGGQADLSTQQRALEAPLSFARRIGALWAGGSLLAAGYAGWFDPLVGATVGLGFGLSGLFASTVTFLVAERVLRPLASRALAERVPRRRLDRALTKRLVFTWLMSSGTGLLGLTLVSLVAMNRPSLTSLRGFAATTLLLSVLVSLIGLLAIWLAARATAEPVEELIDALGKVEVGQLDARVRVWDSTELGVLQAGFNAMAAGLEERERIRDLFGKHVGEDVATEALVALPSFDGDVREVAVLFVDLVGSTKMADTGDPKDVIRLLNSFFDIVIDVVHEYDGWINKFQGDAALAVWGAPLQVPDYARLALSAARVLADRLRTTLPGITAGIGVSGGSVVTGNVGAQQRYEYTVIGDPVNEASRLTELAKEQSGRLIANAALVQAAGGEEAALWTEIDPQVMRGRSGSTRIAVPIRR